MKPTPADGLTIQELITIAKKCRKKIAFAEGMLYAIKQERLGINSHLQASEMLRKHKARLKEVSAALGHKTLFDAYPEAIRLYKNRIVGGKK